MVAATKPAAEKSAGTKGAKPKAAPSRKRKRAKKQPDPNAKGRRNRELGARGEEAAARFLRRNGYHILERNWSCFAGEADIIAIDEEALIFVEVKTRRSCDRGLPSEAVTRAKREKYERIALAYIQDNFFGEITVRFDVVSIVVMNGDRAFIRHRLGAFSAE
ncbi:YraN family protein [uncultured Adlercreutzia sp.]|uniref:YraN family protein n=1 Tax=uncultured Adlercreutzia sp. TaxID=875803 RepID=UPI0026F3B853|nr:YraN family protein [uncultured Adlercreutzia sp.]